MRWSQPLTDGRDEDGRLIADRELVVSRGCRAGLRTVGYMTLRLILVVPESVVVLAR
jgi:hypothetical protein